MQDSADRRERDEPDRRADNWRQEMRNNFLDMRDALVNTTKLTVQEELKPIHDKVNALAAIVEKQQITDDVLADISKKQKDAVKDSRQNVQWIVTILTGLIDIGAAGVVGQVAPVGQRHEALILCLIIGAALMVLVFLMFRYSATAAQRRV